MRTPGETERPDASVELWISAEDAQTIVNGLEAWIDCCETVEEVRKVIELAGYVGFRIEVDK